VLAALGWVVFLAWFFIYMWLRVHPSLIYYRMEPTFPYYARGADFLWPFLRYPGGPVAYACAALSQLFYLGWAGALVGAAVALALAVVGRGVLGATVGPKAAFLGFLPPVLLLGLWGRYAHHLSSALALAVGLAMAWAYMAAAGRRNGALAMLLALASSGLVYYLAGGGFLPFAAACAAYEILVRRRLREGLLFVVLGTAGPFLAAQGLNLSLADAYIRLLPYHPDTDPGLLPLALAALAFVPCAAVVGGLLRRVRGESEAAEASRGRAGTAVWALSRVALLLAAAAVVWFAGDEQTKLLLRIECLAREAKWARLLETARRLPPRRFDLVVNWDVNRALYETGRLPRDMFSWPQQPLGCMPSSLSIVRFKLPPVAFETASDVMFALGHLNEAQHMACEALEIVGWRPWLLRRLALICIAKGEKAAARRYLCLLSKDLFGRRWAEHYLRMLDDDALLGSDAAIKRAREGMIRKADVIVPLPEPMLRQSLEANPRNRMAFEYLMAHYLLGGDLAKFARGAERVRELGYDGMPRCYQEALELYRSLGGRLSPLLEGAIDDESRRRWRELQAELATYRGNEAQALRALAPRYGGTYFFYYTLLSATR